MLVAVAGSTTKRTASLRYCSCCTHAELCIQGKVSNEQRVLQGVRVSSTQIDRTRVVSDSYVKQFAQVLNGGGKTMQLIIAFSFDAHYAVFLCNGIHAHLFTNRVSTPRDATCGV